MSDTNYLTVMQQAMSVNAQFKTEVTNVKNEVSNVVNIYQQLPEKIEKSTNALSSTQQASMGLLGIVQQVVGAFLTMPNDMTLFPTIGDTIKNFGDLQQAASMSVFSIGEQIASSLNLDERLSASSTALMNFVELIQTSGIGEAFQQAFSPAVQLAIVTIAGAIMAGLIPAFISMAVAAWAAVAPLLPFIAAGAALAALAYLIYANWQTITDFFSTIWNTVIETVTGLWNGFKEFAINLWQSFVETIVGSFQWLYDHNYFFQDLVDFILNIWNLLSEKTTEIWNTITGFLTDLWTKIYNGVTTAWNNIFGFISDIWNKIKEGFSGVVNEALNWGGNLISQFISGIQSKVSELWSVVEGIAEDIADFLGFHSPTKLGPGRDADKWAPNLVEMYANGIKNSLPKLQASLGLMAMSLSSAGMGAGGGVATSYGGIVINIYGADANEVMSQLERKLVRLGVKF